ncbi:hypothetical protein LJR010_001789 [Ensifer adhaerens]|uniref:hypothetical protein n=1 Tax=Ensifer adhaerens TaxID=106592 RepID=UPI003999F220
MAAALEQIPTWIEIRKKLKYRLVEQISDLVGSGTKTAGARRFFAWVAAAATEDSEWMKSYLANDNRDVDDLATIRRVHRCIASWTTALLETKKWKSTSVRAQRNHLLTAIDRLREIDEDSFPLIDPRLMPMGAHRDSTGRTALGELDWKELADIEPATRDATAIAIIRSAAVTLFERDEKVFWFGQAILDEKDVRGKPAAWHDIRGLIESEIAFWNEHRCSQFSQPWGDKGKIISSLSDPAIWNDLGLDVDFGTKQLAMTLVSGLIVSCVGPGTRLSQALQTVFCCDTGWNRQPIQYLPAQPFAFRTDKQIFLGSNRVLAALKVRAGHVVHADPANAELIRGLAATNFSSEWDDVAASLKVEKSDEQCRLEVDSELLDLLQRYRAMQRLSSQWTDEETENLFFHAISQRAQGVQVVKCDISLGMPDATPLKRPGVNFSAIRKSFLNSLSSAGLEPSFISEIAGHRSGNILQKNYIIGAQATRTYEEPARFWQGCIQEILLNDKIAFKLSIPDKNREWFRMFGMLTGITAACGLEQMELDGEVTDDYIFVPNQKSYIDLFLAHKGVKQQRYQVSQHRWEIQGEALLGIIKGYGRQLSRKQLGREYRTAARIANARIKSGELTVPLMLEI